MASSIESLILHQGLLSQEEIEEIHRVFVMVDVEGTGSLTPGELRDMAVQITGDPSFTFDDARLLHAQLDTNYDGKVRWEEFLQFVCRWLHERGHVRLKPRTDLPSSLAEKEALHRCLAELFSLGKVNCDSELLPSDHLDNRAETWDYLGEGQRFSEQEKESYYTAAFQSLAAPGHLQQIFEELMQLDLGIVLAGLRHLRDLFGVLTLFQSPADRHKISGYLLDLFNETVSRGLMSRVLQLLGPEYPREVQWEALKIVTFFAPGPRVPGLPETHHFHPKQRSTKQLVLNANAGPLLLSLCESKCVEVRDQALLALGFIARHDLEERNYLCSLGAHKYMLRILQRGLEALSLDLPSVIRAAWMLSILLGATMPRDVNIPRFAGIEMSEIAETLAKLFTLYDQENLIANSLAALAYTLPYLFPNESTKPLLDKTVQLIHHPSLQVKRAALQTVCNVVWASPTQSQLLTEVGLCSKLTDILSHPVDFVVKMDAFTVLRSLIQKGYTWELVNFAQLTTQLQMIIASDPELRWEAVKLVKAMTFSNLRLAVEDMMRAGMTRTLFQYMICFKEVNSVVLQVYSASCFTYNFSYLNDCALVLDRFALLGWPSGDFKMANAFAKYFDQAEAAYMFEVIKVLTNEVRKGNQDLYQLNHGEVTLEKSLCDLLEHFIKLHSSTPSPNSNNLQEYLSSTLTYFKSVLKQTNFDFLTSSQITAESIMSRVRTFVTFTQNVKCMEEQGYPNGDNRLIQNVRREDLNFYGLKRLVTLT
jgi:hypothetical protein